MQTFNMPSWNSYARGSPSAGITVTSIRFMVLKTTPLYAKKKKEVNKIGDQISWEPIDSKSV